MKVELMGLSDLPEIVPGDDLPEQIVASAHRAGQPLGSGDIVVVTQKVVSKAEGRLVRLSDVVPSRFATEWAITARCDPRVIELVLRESRRIVKMDRGVLIVETRHGLVCANAGVDLSNVAGGEVATLLPEDPDASALRIREGITARTGLLLAVLVSDTFGRPWREGLTNVAIGVSGLFPLRSFVGTRDPQGLPLQATIQAVADELAAASGLVSTKLNRTPIVIVRGFPYEPGNGTARELLRPPDKDLFR